jgi:hypothetical protein
MIKPVPAGLASLADFLPSAAEGEGAAPSLTRTVAEAHGFVERNPVAPRKRRKGADEPTYSFTARMTVRSADVFIAWCERERLTYRKGFDRLVATIEEPLEGVLQLQPPRSAVSGRRGVLEPRIAPGERFHEGLALTYLPAMFICISSSCPIQ